MGSRPGDLPRREGARVSDRLLTTREVAAMLALSPETALRWHRSGKMPGGRRLACNVLRFDAGEIEAWLAACSRPAGHPATGVTSP
jgi:predicted DNA-binding transcriptional regulator AlpA